MPAFSKTSLERLETCDERLQRIAHEVIKVFDFTVLCGARTPAEQDKLFRRGVSKLRGDDPRARHVPRNQQGLYDPQARSKAIDIAPWPINWRDNTDWVYLAGLWIMAGRYNKVVLRWGGDWDMDGVILRDQTFDDLGHFELVE